MVIIFPSIYLQTHTVAHETGQSVSFLIELHRLGYGQQTGDGKPSAPDAEPSGSIGRSLRG